MSEIELKACPFCGGVPRISDLPESAIHVACKCGASLFGGKNHHASHEEAVERWNTRAPQWQPIETAPKAKTPMVVVIGVWGSYVTDPYAVFWNGAGWARWPHKAAPTHWLCLPAPPEVVG
jgi:hypothetical protein